MNKRMGIMIVAIFGLLVGGIGILTFDGGAQAQEEPLTATSVASLELTTVIPLDNDGSGDVSIGDAQVYEGVLKDANGNEVGREHGICTAMTVADVWLCEQVEVFADGSIMATGLSVEGAVGTSSQLSITGGTGDYFDIEGIITQTTTDNEDVFTYAFSFEE